MQRLSLQASLPENGAQGCPTSVTTMAHFILRMLALFNSTNHYPFFLKAEAANDCAATLVQ